MSLSLLQQAGCLHAALELTGRFLSAHGQGMGQAGQQTMHTHKTLQVRPHKNNVQSDTHTHAHTRMLQQMWAARIALLVHMRRLKEAELEMTAFGELDNPDLFYQYHAHSYPGKAGVCHAHSYPGKAGVCHAHSYPGKAGVCHAHSYPGKAGVYRAHSYSGKAGVCHAHSYPGKAGVCHAHSYPGKAGVCHARSYSGKTGVYHARSYSGKTGVYHAHSMCISDVIPNAGSMIPFSLRLLHAQLPSYTGNPQLALDRLCMLQGNCQQVSTSMRVPV